MPPLPPLPVVQFASATYSVSENAGQANIAVTLSAPPTVGTTVTVPYSTTTGGTAVAGTDYTSVSNTLTFNSSQTTQSFAVPIIDNKVVGGFKTVNLALGIPTGATLGTPGTATLTILDNDVPPTSVAVTGFGGQFSPDPAPVDTWVAVGLSAQAVRPTPPAPAKLSAPGWNWQLAAIQFSTDSANGPWNDGSKMGVSYMIVSAHAPPPDSTFDYSAVTLSASFPAVTFSTSCSIGGYWQIGYNAQVNYTDTAGGTYVGVGGAAGTGTEFKANILRGLASGWKRLEEPRTAGQVRVAWQPYITAGTDDAEYSERNLPMADAARDKLEEL